MTASRTPRDLSSDRPPSSQQTLSLHCCSSVHHSKSIRVKQKLTSPESTNFSLTDPSHIRYLTGKFYYYAVAYLPGFLASSMAVMIEKPSRRSSLAFYVANVASEALFRIYVARGYVRPVRNGQVYIFTIAIATIMYLAKKHGFEDDPLSAAIKLVVGSEEANKRQRKRHMVDPSYQVEGFKSSEEAHFKPVGPESETAIMRQLQCEAKREMRDGLINRLRCTFQWFRFIVTAKHELCPHQQCSCLHYVTKASARAFLIGCSAQLGLKLLTRVPMIVKNPSFVKELLTDHSLLKIGLFLSAFSGLYKATNCWLRWSLDTSKPINCFIAGIVAGPALFIYPSPTVALYVLWKCLEALFHEAVRKKLIKSKETFIVVLYGLATSQLFYSALMDPRYMKKSYMGFLDRISHHKLHMVNRSVLDVFGTEASSGYEDFFPDLHPKFMSKAFLGSIWIWMIEQKFVAKQLQPI